VYLCDYHLILATKYRRKIFNKGLFAYVERKLMGVCEHYPQIYIHEVNHDKDHIHFLIERIPRSLLRGCRMDA
jgi:putative transposase